MSNTNNAKTNNLPAKFNGLMLEVLDCPTSNSEPRGTTFVSNNTALMLVTDKSIPSDEWTKGFDNTSVSANTVVG